MAIYDQGLRHWPVPFETFFVNRRYGWTHVIASGDPAAPPLVDRVDPDVPVAVEPAGAVQDGEPADVGAPAVVVPQQHEQVGCGQPFQEAWLGHHRPLLPLVARDPLPLGDLRPEMRQG